MRRIRSLSTLFRIGISRNCGSTIPKPTGKIRRAPSIPRIPSRTGRTTPSTAVRIKITSRSRASQRPKIGIPHSPRETTPKIKRKCQIIIRLRLRLKRQFSIRYRRNPSMRGKNRWKEKKLSLLTSFLELSSSRFRQISARVSRLKEASRRI